MKSIKSQTPDKQTNNRRKDFYQHPDLILLNSTVKKKHYKDHVK